MVNIYGKSKFFFFFYLREWVNVLSNPKWKRSRVVEIRSETEFRFHVDVQLNREGWN